MLQYGHHEQRISKTLISLPARMGPNVQAITPKVSKKFA